MGTATGAFSGRANHQLRMETQVASQNIAGNYSTINWQLYAERTSASTSYYLTPSGSSTANVSANVWNGGGWTYDFRSQATVSLGSGSFTVGHNSDGTGSYGFGSSSTAGGSLGSASNSGSESLPTIARATQPTVSPGSGNTGSTFTIGTPAASTSFTHDIFYSFDGGSSYTNLIMGQAGSVASYNWTPPSTLLPNSTGVTAVIAVNTYSGASYIGQKTVNLPLTVPSSVIPVVSNVTWADAQTASPDIPTLMGGGGRFVQSWSSLVPTITSSGAGGSSVTSSSVIQNGQIAASGSAFPSKVALSGAVPYSATAVDTRNRTSDPYNNTVAVTPYNFPSLPTPAVTRTSDAAGNTPSSTGTYLTITPLASVSALIFGGIQKNLLEWQIRIKPTGGAFTVVQAWTAATVSGNTWTTKYVAAGPYASSTEWAVEVSIRDLFGKNGFSTSSTVVALTVLVPSEQVFMDWDGNNGFGLGKYRTNGMLDVMGPIYQNNGKAVASVGTAFQYMPGPLAASSYYTRIATVYGNSGGQGADLEFILSGNGGIGSTSRGTVLVHVTQRGTNVIDVQSWGFGMDQIGDTKFALYTRQLDAFTFEVWTQGSDYQAPQGITILSGWNYVLQCDSSTTSAPASLVSYPIGAGAEPVGTISLNAATSGTPRGWLFCGGQAISRITYARLFAVCGTAYGAGDGTTTFNIPNLLGRIPVMYDGSAEFGTVGQTGGEKAHTLTVSEMPSHDHEIQRSNVAASGQGADTSTVYRSSANSGATYARTQNNGGGAAHNNLQPYVVINYNIKY